MAGVTTPLWQARAIFQNTPAVQSIFFYQSWGCGPCRFIGVGG
jgi:hypothetical protein